MFINLEGPKIALEQLQYEKFVNEDMDQKEAKADKTYYANQQLESVAVKSDGSEFISAHNDGSYITWSLSSGSTGMCENIEYVTFRLNSFYIPFL